MQSFQREEYSRSPSPSFILQNSSQDFSSFPGASMSSTSSPGSNPSSMEALSALVGGGGHYPFGQSAPIPRATQDPAQWDGMVTTNTTLSENSGNVPRVVSTTLASEPESTTPVLKQSPVGKKPAPTRRRQNAKARGGGGDGGGDATGAAEPGSSRRQKRLERNRESARLSRRRRKQYLEVLEEKVTQLGHEMDHGRREHTTQAVQAITLKRKDILEGPTEPLVESLALLETGLARTSRESMVCTTFQSQQLKSFSLAPSTKFMLWLTLQSDTFYRGGRAASERLSAARIGERMLLNGTDKVTPEQSMWPLFCNEVGLSYEQEEKVRTFQRTMLLSQESWLDRHTAFASGKVVQSAHDATQALTLRLGQKERSTMGILSAEQRVKFMSWAGRNRSRIAQTLDKVPAGPKDEQYKTNPQQHVAANLYTLNHRLKSILHTIPPSAPFVTGAALKKLLRRPPFESLGCREAEFLSRDDSFASSGSLKRSASELSMDIDGGDEERPHVPSISPQEAQATAAPGVEEVLGFLKDIIPLPPTAVTSTRSTWDPANGAIPDPAPVSTNWMHQPENMQAIFPPMPVASMAAAHLQPTHARKSSFLPVHLNVVPEDVWPVDGTEDFLMALVDDEDWAIGEGIDMDM